MFGLSCCWGQSLRRLAVTAVLALALPMYAHAQKSVTGIATATDGVHLWYRVVGQGAETVVIPAALYHRNTLDALARGRRLVLFDPRGRGRSDTIPPARAGLEFEVSDLETIRQAVGAERISLIGWSGIGLGAFTYALRHPERLERLVMLAPLAPRRTPYLAQMIANRRSRVDSAEQVRLDARVAAGEFKGREKAHCREIARLNDSAVFGDPAKAHLRPDVCDWPNEWPGRNGPYSRAIMGSFGDWDWRADIAKLAIPLLVIHGDHDTFPLDGSREWVAGKADARLLVLAGAGHWLQYERPRELISAIDGFLKGRWPAGSVAVP